MKVNMREAKSRLSRLGKAAWAGEEVVIARAGEPYLRLVPYRERKARRRLGGLKGRIWMSPDFDETPPDVIEAFWNSTIFPGEEEE